MHSYRTMHRWRHQQLYLRRRRLRESRLVATPHPRLRRGSTIPYSRMHLVDCRLIPMCTPQAVPNVVPSLPSTRSCGALRCTWWMVM